MFEKYKDLIDSASCRCTIEFEEGRAVRAYLNNKELGIPMVNTVYIPDVFVGIFCSKGYLEYSRFFDGIVEHSKYDNLPDVSGKEFYLWGFLHGYDYSHHGESHHTGLLIDAGFLDERKDQDITEESHLYKILKCFEDMEAPQCGPRQVKIDQRKKLEEKVVKLIPVSLE